ncbi:MAG: hypothetical protein JXA67_19075 [Micromonosporaceae bacterium]|nr:hypothetical protein [Micromonosporaceae bacterium]
MTGEEFRRRFPRHAARDRRERDEAGRPDASADRIRAAMALVRQPAKPEPVTHTDVADLLRATPDEDTTIWR